MPQVSVVIPAYNHERFIRAAVNSALAQSFTDIEVLVVDDGSSDDTGAMLAGYGPPVRYIRQDNSGSAAARNRGIVESRGLYVAFLDGDDVWRPEKLQRQLTTLGENPRAGACYCAIVEVDADLNPLRHHQAYRGDDLLGNLLTHGNVVGIPSAVMIRRDLLDRVGCFDQSLSYCTDWDLWIRLARDTAFCYVDEPLVAWRQHGDNMTRQISLLERDSRRLLDRALADPGTPFHLRAKSARVLGRNWMTLAGCYFRAGSYRDFARCAGSALRADPWQGRRLLAYPLRRLRRTLRFGPTI